MFGLSRKKQNQKELADAARRRFVELVTNTFVPEKAQEFLDEFERLLGPKPSPREVYLAGKLMEERLEAILKEISNGSQRPIN